jgi:hypothetical protein
MLENTPALPGREEKISANVNGGGVGGSGFLKRKRKGKKES